MYSSHVACEEYFSVQLLVFSSFCFHGGVCRHGAFGVFFITALRSSASSSFWDSPHHICLRIASSCSFWWFLHCGPGGVVHRAFFGVLQPDFS